MDDRWFTRRHRTGEVCFSLEIVSGHVLRICDDLWEHTCLDLDLVSSTATERDQGNCHSDDPDQWDAQSCPLRWQQLSLQIQVAQSDYDRWIAKWKQTIRDIEENRLQSRIFPSAAEWMMADAIHSLETLKGQAPGWINADPAIGELVREQLLNSPKTS